MSQTFQVKLVALLWASVSSVPALAQDASVNRDTDPTIPLTKTDATIVVTGAPQERQSLAVSVATLNADDLERLQIVSIADALATLPGVNATRNGPIGALTSVRIRGADAAQTLVIIDGVRVGDPTSPGGGFDFGLLLAGGVDRIDVLRGSNSVIWGSDAIGGVVFVETGGPSSLSAEYGSHDTANINARLHTDVGPARLSLGGGWFDTQGISAASGGTERDGFRQYRGNARLAVDLADNVDVLVSVLYADSQLEIDGFSPPAFSFGDTAEFQNAEETYATTHLRHRVGRRFVHSLRFTLADLNRDTFNPAFGNAPDFQARGRSERVGWQGEYGLAGEAISVVVGADREWNRSLTASSFSSDTGRTATTGLYGHASLRPTDRVHLGIGARHDDHRQFGGDTSLSAHGLYQTGLGLSVRGSYGEGYKAPTLFQLSGTPGGFGNPALRPEESRAYDIGVIIAPNRLAGIRIETSLFRRDSRNLIDFVSCAGPSAPPICAGGARPFGTYANIDRARAQGGEVEIRLIPSSALTVTAGYAYTATRDRTTGQFGSGNRLARRPVHSAVLGADYTIREFSIGGDVRLIGDSFDDAGNVTRLDGFALVSLRGRIHLTDRIDLFARIENLFNADYQVVAGYGTYGRTGNAGLRLRY